MQYLYKKPLKRTVKDISCILEKQVNPVKTPFPYSVYEMIILGTPNLGSTTTSIMTNEYIG